MIYKNKLVINAQNEKELANFLNEIGTDEQKIDFNRIEPIVSDDNMVEKMEEIWGCCSNAMEVEHEEDENSITLYFTTRGGNCESIISKLSHLCKDTSIEFIYQYASDTIAERCGKVESYGYDDYVMVYYAERTDLALECWCECWQEDIDMFVWDDEYKTYILNDGEDDDDDWE